MRRLPEQRHERHREDRDHRAGGEHGRRPASHRARRRGSRRARRSAARGPRSPATAGRRRRRSRRRGRPRRRSRARSGSPAAAMRCGSLHLLAGRRDGIQSDEGEEDRARRRGDAGRRRAGRSRRSGRALNAVSAIAPNMTSTPSLMRTMIVLTIADSRVPRMSSSAHRPTSTTAGRLMIPPSSGPPLSAAGSVQPKRLAEQVVEVAAPPRRDRGGRDAVLEHQARGDAHRDDLAERRVRVGVGRARDRHRGGHLGVADGGEPRGDRRRSRTRGARPDRRAARPRASRRTRRCRPWRRRRTSRAGRCRSPSSRRAPRVDDRLAPEPA